MLPILSVKILLEWLSRRVLVVMGLGNAKTNLTEENMKKAFLGLLMVMGLALAENADARSILRPKCHIPTSDPYCFYEGYEESRYACLARGPLGRCLRYGYEITCVWNGGPMRCQ